MPLCPKCARRVPASVATCRCGHPFDAAETVAGPAPEPAEAPDRKSPPMFVVAAALGGLLIGMLFWMNREDSPRSVSAPNAAAPSISASPGVAAVRRAASEPAVANAFEPQAASDP